ncbi:dTDP-4-dehydrorhamnose 3,5-epimerase [Herbihabitans rhizosphaerae]|uniref:dTDP-4-dehydrorhamnose 3,5-epimerase n=1 Tax=Herbihabitans rhizosphaerae TaxID=1872711 RepID=A0A4Q7KII0_9PSEU|nr:dTDP-4-dehydrorhamnose 3,5-epimerase [Herbihabitans rhizosphaerae]RZS32708.1 dTDP-4-dehydrorhamnose 3,5-epimerase [Herbihabitans rhizosphaerae]
MHIEPLGIDGAYLVKPKIFPDDRGLFLETFSQPAFTEAIGHPMTVAQVNCSSSRRGTVRGLHAVALPGQARYMTCQRGALIDIVVDTRIGSPTYGEHVAVELSADNRHALYLAEGLSHGFSPLADEATAVYLCSSTYSPGGAIQVHPLDPALDLPWPTGHELVLSDKDKAAPTLAEAEKQGLLPTYAECVRLYEDLRAGHNAERERVA